jgi:hypothetical protein
MKKHCAYALIYSSNSNQACPIHLLFNKSSLLIIFVFSPTSCRIISHCSVYPFHSSTPVTLHANANPSLVRFVLSHTLWLITRRTYCKLVSHYSCEQQIREILYSSFRKYSTNRKVVSGTKIWRIYSPKYGNISERLNIYRISNYK